MSIRKMLEVCISASVDLGYIILIMLTGGCYIKPLLDKGLNMYNITETCACAALFVIMPLLVYGGVEIIFPEINNRRLLSCVSKFAGAGIVYFAVYYVCAPGLV